jgi:hypothetical protein
MQYCKQLSNEQRLRQCAITESLSDTVAPCLINKYMHAFGYQWYVCDTYVEALVKHKW